MAVTFASPIAPGAAVDGAQLHDELARAGVAPAGGIRVEVGDLVADAGLATETRTPTVWVTVPDGTAEEAVAAVVAAHAPRARYDPAVLRAARAAPLAADRRRADLTRLRRRVAAAGTVADLAPAVLGVLDYLEKEATA